MTKDVIEKHIKIIDKMELNKLIDVVILAAGSIKDKLHFANFIFDSPALIPINVRSSISYILDFYQMYNVRIHLVVNEKDKYNVKQEIQYYQDVNIVSIKNSKNVNDTLIQTIQLLQIDGEIIINLATTIPTTLVEKHSVLIEDLESLNVDWSSVLINKDISFIYKNNNIKVISNAFMGVFRCHSSILYKSLNTVTDKSDLLNLVEVIHNQTNFSFIKSNWIDCGHEQNFYDAKAKLISSRSFNAIEITPITGIIKKSSKNKEKFKDEIKYIEQLPQDIALFFPSIYSDIKIYEDQASVEMEYYGYNTLAEYMLYWDVKNYTWNKIFFSLEIVLSKFKKYKYSIGRNAYHKFMYEKLISRVEEFKMQLGNDSKLFDDEIIINGKKYKNINIMMDKIENKVNNLYKENDFCIMHGDLCFNNILYDIKSNIVRLIDARGSFGESCVGIYGDMKYDLAKLTHSVIGSYDFIVNNLFSLICSDDGFAYKVVRRENYEILYDLNINMIKQLEHNEKDILFLVGILFISMCPLHADDVNRQKVMYLHGLKYINENLE